MRIFLTRISSFLLFIIFAYPLMIFLIGILPVPQGLISNLNDKMGSYGHLFTRLNEVKHLSTNVDILFLGSSHSYRGFDPRNFNCKTFNLGSSAQTPIQTKLLLERYLDKLSPDLVIYEVYPRTLEMDGVESSLDLIANDRNDYKSIQMAFRLNNIKTYNTLIYHGLANILNINKNFEEPIKKDNDTYIPGGFVESEMGYFKPFDHPRSEWQFRDDQVEAFNECIQFLKMKNIKTILVFAPITEGLYNSYINNHYVDSIFSTYKLEYYNFNRLMQLKDSLDFYDADHLNQNGVKLFNTKLLEILSLK
jgi:hypothetical protein